MTHHCRPDRRSLTAEISTFLQLLMATPVIWSSELLPGLVMTNSLLLKMAIEIVGFPIKHGDFPWLCESLPDGITLEDEIHTYIEKTPFPYISYFYWKNKHNEFFARLIYRNDHTWRFQCET